MRILLILLFSTNVIFGQIIDRVPAKRENTLTIEGGRITMDIDTESSLKTLIEKLNEDWNFIQTGKAYWIGYTNDMYSIAARGDMAIPELVHFFKSTKSKNGKIGAIYTLHLIGINRQIIGRYSEKFVNPKARTALLEMLPEKEHTYWIMQLLMRDPWKSDIPYLFNIIDKEKDEDILWPIINALKRYDIEELPINNEIPEKIKNLTIDIKFENDNDDFLDRFNNQIKQTLALYEEKYPDYIKVEKDLYKTELSKYSATEISETLNIESFLWTINIAPEDISNYTDIGCKIGYFYKDNQLHFCTIKTAQKILKKWWADLPLDKKANFK